MADTVTTILTLAECRYIAGLLGYDKDRPETWPVTSINQLFRVYENQGHEKFREAIARAKEEEARERTASGSEG
jgi:hypothetical protein